YAMPFLLIICLAAIAVLIELWRRERQASRRAQEENDHRRVQESDFLRRTLRRAELLHRLADGLEDGLFILGADMRVLFVNLGAQHFFPPVNEPVGRKLVECIPHTRILELVEKAVSEGKRQSGEISINHVSDSAPPEDRIYDVLALPLQSERSQAAEGDLLLILRDETAKHTLEKIRKDFVANASHELRTPLSIIIGYLENLIEHQIEDPQEIQRAFAVMKKHGDRLGQIVEDLLVISRMESGQDESLRMEEFDLLECANDVVHRLSPVITAKGAEVQVVVPPKFDARLCGDRFYWDQILFNLVQNALKENLARGLMVQIALKSTGQTMQIEIRDNGVGIPQADLPFVFKRFYRVMRSEGSREIKGTGLGLSIVRRAVEAHKGTITLRSTPGVETVFTIQVPQGL
ncbi:MAG: PAS domain-containing sensor histidine kinase, partial [Verrucomicrobia bacterium]|nr:PAS domain-containing sensor histidine kinase [Verrucomicrobiota bacterium]